MDPPGIYCFTCASSFPTIQCYHSPPFHVSLFPFDNQLLFSFLHFLCSFSTLQFLVSNLFLSHTVLQFFNIFSHYSNLTEPDSFFQPSRIWTVYNSAILSQQCVELFITLSHQFPNYFHQHSSVTQARLDQKDKLSLKGGSRRTSLTFTFLPSCAPAFSLYLTLCLYSSFVILMLRQHRSHPSPLPSSFCHDLSLCCPMLVSCGFGHQTSGTPMLDSQVSCAALGLQGA